MIKPKQMFYTKPSRCQKCGAITVFKSGNQKYCRKCSNELNHERARASKKNK